MMISELFLPKMAQNRPKTRFFDPQHMYIFGKLRISTFQWFRSFFKISDFSEIFLDFTEIGGGAVTEIGGLNVGGLYLLQRPDSSCDF